MSVELNKMNAEDVDIVCSWTIENIEQVRNKILWKDDLCELSEETNVENCFMVVQQANSSDGPCTLKIILKNNRKFSNLQILSEVSFMICFFLFITLNS